MVTTKVFVEILIFWKINNESISRYSCNVCNKQFTRKFTLIRHKEACHGICIERKFECRSSRICCTQCSDKFFKISELITHLHTKHGIELTIEEYEFDSRCDFETWKESTEVATCTYYVKARNFYRKHLKTSYYDCHRSGFYERQGNKRAQKLKGTIRINGTCPARIKLVEDCNSGKHKVNFISTHVGHYNEPERLRLTKQERLDLATKLQQGVSKDEILSSIRDNFSPTKRLSYITRHDLNNITSAFNLKGEVRLNEDDAHSVDLWVTNCSSGDFNPVLGYKPIGDSKSEYSSLTRSDFFLVFANDGQLDILKLYGNSTVMIESTRETNQYGIYLSTLMVVGSNWEGIPVAFMFHTTQTEEVFQLFFNCIRDKITVLQPRTFISDDTAAYSAWGSVFDYPEMKLISTWHVKRAFDHILSTKIANASRRQEVQQLLQSLIEKADVISFESSLQSSVGQWIGNRETKKFGLFFQSHYGNRPKEWAHCYRQQQEKNTDTCFGKWHDDVCSSKQNSKLNSKCEQRMITAINNCVACARVRFFNTAVYQSCGHLSVKLGLLRKNHKACLDMTTEGIENVEQKKWIVPISDNRTGEQSETCVVELLNVPFICGACDLVCNDCKVCIHAFSCSCTDYQLKFNMCKHIHLVCHLHDLGNQQVITEIIEKANGEEGILIIHLDQSDVQEDGRTVILQESQHYVKDTGSLEERRSQVHREIDELHNLVDRYTNVEQLNMFSCRFLSLQTAFEIAEVSRIPLAEITPENF